jgi:hypothetical protein
LEPESITEYEDDVNESRYAIIEVVSEPMLSTTDVLVGDKNTKQSLRTYAILEIK